MNPYQAPAVPSIEVKKGRSSDKNDRMAMLMILGWAFLAPEQIKGMLKIFELPTAYTIPISLVLWVGWMAFISYDDFRRNRRLSNPLKS